MYPPTSSKPMEAAAVARRGGLLAPSRAGSSRARARTWCRHGTVGVGYSSALPAARRRLLVASLGVRESLPAQSPGEEAAVEVEEDAGGSAETLPSPDPDEVPAKTVRVKFVLEKACAFGQHFLLVGDDPALGLWDPAKATALEWSEGHVWTVMTDLPANKSIEFKFLLRDASGQVLWQHGDNRTLQTTGTPHTLVVQEDWDHAENQRVSEEEEHSTAEEDLTLTHDLALEGSDGAVQADELRPGENLESDESAVTDSSLHEEMEGANEENQAQFILEDDQKSLNELYGEADSARQNDYPFDDDGMPNEDDAAICQEDAHAQMANKMTSIFENDLAWAREALKGLLRFLGFQTGTTRT